jgi:type VI secretion system secreted protein Hcp
VLSTGFLVATSAFAGGFLKYDGVKGESTENGHKKQIDVLAWSWGTGTPPQAGRGGCGNVEREYLVISKYVDSTSPEFVRLAESCGSADRVVLEVPIVSDPEGGGAQRVMRIRMEDVRVRKIEMGSSGDGETPTENVSLEFAMVEIRVVPLDRSE